MTDLNALLRAIPIGDIARQVGVDEATAREAVRQALPALVGGMAQNAKNERGAAALTKAIADHHDAPASPSRVAEVDTADGDKIVRKVFGDTRDEVVGAVAKSSSPAVTKDLIAKVLPIVAPIALAWLSRQVLGGAQQKPGAQPKGNGQAQSKGGLGDLIGGALGGGGIGDLLGGLLGGTR